MTSAASYDRDESRVHALAKALWLYYTENEPGHKWTAFWDMSKAEAEWADRCIEAMYGGESGNVATGGTVVITK